MVTTGKMQMTFNKLVELFNKMEHKNNSGRLQAKWKLLGPINLSRLLSNNYMSIGLDPKTKLALPVRKREFSISIPKELGLGDEKISYRKGIYSGQVNKHEKPHGIGRMIDEEERIYEGQFINGIEYGFARMIMPWAKGAWTIGWWKNG